jgi:hypothetical protein
MDRDYESIAAKLADLDANTDWQSAAREIHEAVVQILQGMNELQERIVQLEGENATG